MVTYGSGCNRKPGAISKPVPLKVIPLSHQKPSHTFGKPNVNMFNQNTSTNTYTDEIELMSKILYMNLSTKSKREYIMKHGNCVKDVPTNVRRFLEGNKEVETMPWENPNFCGKYVVHRDIDPLTGRQRMLIIRVEWDDTKKHEETSDDWITEVTTTYYIFTISYEYI